MYKSFYIKLTLTNNTGQGFAIVKSVNTEYPWNVSLFIGFSQNHIQSTTVDFL